MFLNHSYKEMSFIMSKDYEKEYQRLVNVLKCKEIKIGLNKD